MSNKSISFIIVALSIVMLVKFIKFYVNREKFNTSEHIFAFIGGVGSGKTISAIHVGINIFKKFKYKKGLFITNFPMKIKQKNSNYACILDEDIFKIKKKIPDNSVIIIDEAGAYFDKWGYKKLGKEALYMRLSRQFNNCYIIFTDQRFGNIPIVFRDKINIVYYLSECSTYFFHMFASSKVRKVYCAQDLFQTVNPEATYSFFKVKNNYKTRMFKKAYNDLLEPLEPRYYDSLDISAETLDNMIKEIDKQQFKKTSRKEISGSKNENEEKQT